MSRLKNACILLLAAPTTPAPGACVPLYGKCGNGAAPCCESECFERTVHYSQCRPSCPDIDHWACHTDGHPPPAPPPLPSPPQPITTEGEDPHLGDIIEQRSKAPVDIAAFQAQDNGSDSLESVGILHAMIDPSKWVKVDNDDLCTLRLLVGRTPAPTYAEVVEFKASAIACQNPLHPLSSSRSRCEAAPCPRVCAGPVDA